MILLARSHDSNFVFGICRDKKIAQEMEFTINLNVGKTSFDQPHPLCGGKLIRLPRNIFMT